MAFQGKTLAAGAGKLSTNPPSGTPLNPAYRAGKEYRGVIDPLRKDGKAPDHFGANGYSGASSTDVASSRGLVDFDTIQNDADPVLDKLASTGTKSALNDDSGTGNPVEDLQRKIDASPLTPAHGMKSPNKPGEIVPTKI